MTDYTLDEYARLVLAANGKTTEDVKYKDGLVYFEYDFLNTEINSEYHFYSFLYKSEDAFWLVQFATLKENIDAQEANIFKYAKSVEF